MGGKGERAEREGRVTQRTKVLVSCNASSVGCGTVSPRRAAGDIDVKRKLVGVSAFGCG